MGVQTNIYIRPASPAALDCEAEEVLLFLLYPVGAISKKVWLWRTVEIRGWFAFVRSVKYV